MDARRNWQDLPDAQGRFGPYGGRFVAETLMPLVLELDNWDLWLKGDSEAAAALMKPANEDVLTERAVNKAVGNVRNNYAELLEAP